MGRKEQADHPMRDPQSPPDTTHIIEWVRFPRSEYFPLPVEPLFDLKVAAMLLPMHYPSLRKLLSRHKAEFPARYRRSTGGRRIRLLSASEIRRLRPMVVQEANPDHVLEAFLPSQP